MAEFEPRPRPPAPGRRNVGRGNTARGEEEQDDIQRGFARAEEWVDRASEFSPSRFVPRWMKPRTPKFIRRRIDKLPPEVRYRLSVVSGFVQTFLIIATVTVFLALLFKGLTNITIVEPSNGKEVLELVDNPSSADYSVETIRFKKFPGITNPLRTETLRGFEVIPGKRRMRGLIYGVDFAPYRTSSDGKVWLVKYENDESRVLRNPRSSAPCDLNNRQGCLVPSEDQLRPLYASDLKNQAGKIISSKVTASGKRAWLVEVNPSRQDLLRMLSADLLQLDDQDTKAIRAGKYKIQRAVATVIRPTRQLYQVEILMKVNGADLHILLSYRSQDRENTSLQNLDLVSKPESLIN